jgi:hypothetical protein
MATMEPKSNFAVLLGGAREAVDFEPLTIAEPVVEFQAFSTAQETKLEAIDLVPDTYQRITPPLAEHPAGLNSLLAAKDLEIEHFKALLSRRDAELEEVRRQMDVEKNGAKMASDKAMAGQILDALSAIEVRVVDELAQDISSILLPFVTEQLRQRVLEEFDAIVGKCLTGGGIAKIKISGPTDLMSAFREVFANRLADCELTETDEIEIMAELNSKLISTRLDHWSTILVAR